MASRAAIFAMGKPVALEASALLRETRGFISITTIWPVRGSTANWMLQPPVSTPTARMMAIAVSRIRWYSRSVRVMAGATVTESPVCTPIGSMFSIEQTTTTLSLGVAHELELELLPADDALLEQDLVGGAGVQAGPGDAAQVRLVARDAGPEAAEGEGRPDDDRVAEVLASVCDAFVQVAADLAARDLARRGR